MFISKGKKIIQKTSDLVKYILTEEIRNENEGKIKEALEKYENQRRLRIEEMKKDSTFKYPTKASNQDTKPRRTEKGSRRKENNDIMNLIQTTNDLNITGMDKDRRQRSSDRSSEESREDRQRYESVQQGIEDTTDKETQKVDQAVIKKAEEKIGDKNKGKVEITETNITKTEKKHQKDTGTEMKDTRFLNN